MLTATKAHSSAGITGPPGQFSGRTVIVPGIGQLAGVAVVVHAKRLYGMTKIENACPIRCGIPFDPGHQGKGIGGDIAGWNTHCTMVSLN